MEYLSGEDRLIAEELLDRLRVQSMTEPDTVLLRLEADGPSELTPEYRAGEIEKVLRGIPSEWGETEIEAERRYREREGLL